MIPRFPSKQTAGFGLIETVVGIAILIGLMVALTNAVGLASRTTEKNVKSQVASLLLTEGIEAVRTLRDTSWQNKVVPLTIGTPYYLSFDGIAWTATTSAQYAYVQGMYERKIVFANVNRDINDDIITSGGTLDLKTRKVTVTVSWFDRTATSSEQISTYITNLFAN